MLVDTAGRLQNKAGLMDELGKVKRVIEKQAPVDEVLLVLDATTGQNGLVQARVFAEVVDVTGIVLTKLDGTAKGGIVVAVQRELGVPVKLVGLGEGADDLAPFDAERVRRRPARMTGQHRSGVRRAAGQVRRAVRDAKAARHPYRRMDLTELAQEFGSDKWGTHRYTPHYQHHFAHLRDRHMLVLELGIGGYAREAQGGASLRMWKWFFPRAQIVGVDIKDKSFVNEPRIRAIQGLADQPRSDATGS